MKWVSEIERRWHEHRRDAQLHKALPEAIDLMALVLQAGLDVQIGLQHYLERGPDGPLREEFALFQKDLELGVSRVNALQNLRQRNREPSLRESAQMIIQGIEMGTSLAPLLRSLAQSLRRQRVL